MIRVVQSLEALKDPSAVDALSATLEDQDPLMRRRVAWALGQINDPQAVQTLISAMKHWDDTVRKEASESLSKRMGYPQADEALLALLWQS